MTRKPSSPEADAYHQALSLLVRREHSQRELRRKLRARVSDAPTIDAVIERLGQQGYQDDGRFAEVLIRTRLNGGYGPLHIRAELGTHGVDGDTIAARLAEAEPDWTELAVKALRRRYGPRAPRDRAEMLKRSQFLQRRGFDSDSIRAALQRDPSGN